MSSYIATMSDASGNTVYPQTHIDGIIGADSGWKQLTLYVSTGGVFIRKYGKLVTLVGTVKFNTNIGVTNPYTWVNIPEGYRRVANDGNPRYRFFSAFSPTTDARVRLQMSGNGDVIFCITSTASANEYAIDLQWLLD